MKIKQVLKSLFLIIIFISTSSMTFDEVNVFICKGKYSKKYHYSKSCRGLSNCSTQVYSVTLQDAKKLGRTLCGWED